MLISTWLSALKDRSRCQKRARRRRRNPVLLGGVRDWLLEDRCLLSSSVSLPANTTGITSIGQVLYNGVTAPDNQKTITIINNSDQTIYPFLEGVNSKASETQTKYNATAVYDPYDPVNHEYRGYIGYTDGTNNYAGLPSHSSITVTNVPMAFWDTGRIILSTDGANQFKQKYNEASPTGAPFYFQTQNVVAKYYLQTEGSDFNKLYFTPVYNSFDANGNPTDVNWKSPVNTTGNASAGGLMPGKYDIAGPGLPANTTATVDASHPDYITLSNPLSISQSGQYTFNAAPFLNTTTPSDTAHYIQDGYALTKNGSSTSDGVVMWYQALSAINPASEASYQLVEPTFRSTLYAATGFEQLMTDAQYADAKNNLIDYDISYVDSLDLPVAMEAGNVPIPHTSDTAPFGWAGGGESLGDFQKALAAFSSTNPQSGPPVNYLGWYFNGRGYPTFVNLAQGSNVKLPAGFNLFNLSPASPAGLSAVNYYKKFSDNSTINGRQYALTSAGTGPTSFGIQGKSGTENHEIMLNNPSANMADKYLVSTLIKTNVDNGFTYDVKYNNTSLGHVTGLITQNGNVVGVTVSGIVPTISNYTGLTFDLPGTGDYATKAIEKLWYSWAKYYVDNVKAAPPTHSIAGTIENNILTLNDTSYLKGLVPGMKVTGTGLPNGAFILYIDNNNEIHLSTMGPTTSTPGSFTFTKPDLKSIAGYNPNMSLDTFKFDSGHQENALAFARTAYTVMAAWGQLNFNSTTPLQLLANIIGGAFDKIPAQDANNPDIKGPLTNMSKSLLRGVPDYTSPQYSDPSQWYPDPALPTPGLTGGIDMSKPFNVYNLDPIVWFIHDKLGSTSYAFALDDDVGNVGAGGATALNISVGGLTGLPNKDPLNSGSLWGVVATNATPEGLSPSSVLGGMTSNKIPGQINAFDDNLHKPGALVNGKGVPIGTTVQIASINDTDVSKTNLTLSSPLTPSTQKQQFIFFGPLNFVGTVLGANQPSDTIYLDSADSYNTLLKLGPLANIRVTGEGIDPHSTVTIKSVTLDNGKYIVTLSSSLNKDLVSQKGGSYSYTFGSPVVPLVSNPGFEWSNTQGLTNKYYVNGASINPPNPTDANSWYYKDASDSTSDPRYAGIASDAETLQSPDYTKNNKPAPQGLQVGFVQGTSYIISAPKYLLHLVPGTYKLSFRAAQSAPMYPNKQTLDVQLVPGGGTYYDTPTGGVSIGTITPSAASFQNPTFTFTVGSGANDTVAPGTYAIMFKGTTDSKATALIDDIVLTPPSSPSDIPPPLPVSSPPPASSPPPVSSPSPVSSPLSSSTLSPAQEFFALVVDEIVMTIDEVVDLTDLRLGMVPDPTLQSSIAADQNAINNDPFDHTLLGQLLIDFVFLQTVKDLTGSSASDTGG